MSVTFTAAVTAIDRVAAIDERCPGGWSDTITIWDSDGDVVETIEVESTEDQGAYEQAISLAKWAIRGTTPNRQHVYGGRGWVLVSNLEPGDPIPPGRNGGMDGYVAGKCGHRMFASEWQAGFRKCERCG